MSDNNRWLNTRNEEGKVYDAKFEAMEEAGLDVHGEANFVMRYEPKTVLDAGCGTGRVAIELARRGCAVVGVDIDTTMLARAREKAPHLQWHQADLATLKLAHSCSFELIIMAGNVLLFVAPDSEGEVISNMSHYLAHGGRLVSGFQLNGQLSLREYDKMAEEAGLSLQERYASWEGQPWHKEVSYAVSVHQKD